MSNPTDKGVCDKHFLCKKGVCDQCFVCRYCNAPPYFQSKINQKYFGIHIQSKIEHKKRKFNRTTIYRGRDKLSLTDELKLCDDVNVLSNKENLLKVGKLLGVESKTCSEIPNNGWNMEDTETEGRKLM